MKKYLRIHISSGQPERCSAIEFLSEQYLPRNIAPEHVVWETACALVTPELIAVLRDRGWHQTDIGDELDEARLDKPGIKNQKQGSENN